VTQRRPVTPWGIGIWLAEENRDHLAPLRVKQIMHSTIDAHYRF
jgi:hypothetical protein